MSSKLGTIVAREWRDLVAKVKFAAAGLLILSPVGGLLFALGVPREAIFTVLAAGFTCLYVLFVAARYSDMILEDDANPSAVERAHADLATRLRVILYVILHGSATSRDDLSSLLEPAPSAEVGRDGLTR